MAKQIMTVSELQAWRKRKFLETGERVGYPDFACSSPGAIAPPLVAELSMPLTRRSKRKRGTATLNSVDADGDEDCTVVDTTDSRTLLKSNVPCRKSKTLRSMCENNAGQPGISNAGDRSVICVKKLAAFSSNAGDQTEVKSASSPQACDLSSPEPARRKRLVAVDPLTSQGIESEGVFVESFKTEKKCNSPLGESVLGNALVNGKEGPKPVPSGSPKLWEGAHSAKAVKQRKRNLSPDINVQSAVNDQPRHSRDANNSLLPSNVSTAVFRPATASSVDIVEADVNFRGATGGRGSVGRRAHSPLHANMSMYEPVSTAVTAKKASCGLEGASKVAKEKEPSDFPVRYDNSLTANPRKRARTSQMGAVVVLTDCASRRESAGTSSVALGSATINRRGQQQQVTNRASSRTTKSRRNAAQGSGGTETIPCVSSDDDECIITSQQLRSSRNHRRVQISASGASASSTCALPQYAQMEQDAEYARQLQAQFDREAALERRPDSGAGNVRHGRGRHDFPSSSATASAAMDCSPRTTSLLHLLSPEAPPPTDLFSRRNQQHPTNYQMDRLDSISHRINSMRLLLNMSNEEQQQYHDFLAEADSAVNGSRSQDDYLALSAGGRLQSATSQDLDQGVMNLLRSHRGSSHQTAFRRFYRGSSRNSHHAASSRPLTPFHAETDDYEALLELADLIGEVKRRGLSEVEIQVLPTRSYSERDAEGETSGESAADTCHICFDKFEPEECLRILPCCHEYHVDCIDEWIKRNATCPICRMEVHLD